jgi:NAD(P)-dependent dehydrogenase (short-subunit alcohol dehydrogenase family)
MTELAYVVSHGDEAVTEAVVRTLERDGWTVMQGNAQPNQAVDAVVYVPGLLEDTVGANADPAAELLDLVESLRPQFPSAADGGARVVAVGSRDWLGWASRPRVAAHAAGVAATVRSLALAHGQAGITVNAVMANPPNAAVRREAGPVPGTHLYEPVPLTVEPVTPDDIAAAVAFFLNRRSGYITGQIMHCCGGASLLSSLSV